MYKSWTVIRRSFIHPLTISKGSALGVRIVESTEPVVCAAAHTMSQLSAARIHVFVQNDSLGSGEEPSSRSRRFGASYWPVDNFSLGGHSTNRVAGNQSGWTSLRLRRIYTPAQIVAASIFTYNIELKGSWLQTRVHRKTSPDVNTFTVPSTNMDTWLCPQHLRTGIAVSSNSLRLHRW